MSYLRQAIAPSTRETYAAGIAAFRRWRRERGRPEDELPTTDETGCWLAEMADRGGLSAGTLRTYASAISTWFHESRHPDNHAPNPASDPNVRRLLKGIQREEARRAQALPLESVENKPADLQLPTLLRFPFDDDEPRDCMLKAAACLAVGGGLRPGELLGNSAQTERALRREQFSFFSDAAGVLPMQPPAPGGVVASPLPCVLQLTLRMTKTSQAKPVVKMIAAPSVIAAVWRWFCITAGRPPRSRFFKLGDQPLSTYALVKDMERRHAKAGLGAVTYTGKSWRRGGAATLASLGYDEADIAALGWAVGSKMWERYADDPQARRQRAIVRGGLMEPERTRDQPAAASRR